MKRLLNYFVITPPAPQLRLDCINMPVRLGINSTRGAISSAQSCIIRSSARAAPVVSRQAFHERRQELSTSASAEQAAPQSSASGSSPSTSAKVAAAETQAPSSPSKLLSGFAKLLGYNHNSATAIRSTNYYYDRICNRDKQQEKEFWYEGEALS